MKAKTINRGISVLPDTWAAIQTGAADCALSASTYVDIILRDALGLQPTEHRKRGERDNPTGGQVAPKNPQ